MIDAKKKCLGCGWPKVNWTEQRRQYGRIIRAGLTPEQAKTLVPRCQKCTTEILKPTWSDIARAI
jgi:hypothetical protein